MKREDHKRDEAMAEAVRLLGMDSPDVADRDKSECAKWIRKIASEYRAELDAAQNTSRPALVKNQLLGVSYACNRAAAAIDDLHNDALDLWHSCAQGWRHPNLGERMQLLYERALGVGFPDGKGFDYPNLDDPNDDRGGYPSESLVFLVPRLRMTAELARLLAEEMGEDKGGRGNTYQREHGSPVWHLVRACWEPFAENGGKPTRAENGDFNRFVQAVHEFATGDDEPPNGLRDHVRNCVAIMDEIVRINKGLPRFFGDQGATATDDEWARYEELNAALSTGRPPHWMKTGR
jgi:hypothetical protein